MKTIHNGFVTRVLQALVGSLFLCTLAACGGGNVGSTDIASNAGDPPTAGGPPAAPVAPVAPVPPTAPVLPVDPVVPPTAPAPGVQLQSCAGIMPLGDSITLGVNGGYRNNLYTGLQQNNCGVDFVGSQFDVNTHVADKDHEGHPGFAIGDIANSANAWLASTQPNIVILMIGTNDTAWWTNNDATEIGARHSALIDQIRAARPNVWIFVGSIPPQTSVMIHGKPDGSANTTSVDRAVLTQQFNTVIRNNVDGRVAAGQRVRFVDVNSVLTTADLYDGIHPTEAAHAKVAQVFLDAVRTVLVP